MKRGWSGWLAAQQAKLEHVPCWIKDMTDEQAYMELVLCNTQSELHPLEEGKHAAESGMDLKAYAEASGKAYKALYNKVTAYRVAKVTAYRVADVSHVGIETICDAWRNLAEIHAAQDWLWSALVLLALLAGPAAGQAGAGALAGRAGVAGGSCCWLAGGQANREARATVHRHPLRGFAL